tara:strand:- start:359 stop:1141 length:783 start_codon:yes stop_codon:yes gene_type:complete
MPHISFSELKNWTQCPHYRKLVNEDKLNPFTDSIFTTFGTAVHSVCEDIAPLDNEVDDPAALFEGYFEQELKKLEEISPKQVEEFKQQGREIVVEVMQGLKDYFGDYEVIDVEEQLFERIIEFPNKEYDFKGFIDLIVKTADGKYHILDWKTCSWGWNSRRKSEKITTYQLTLYKKFFAEKHNVDMDQIETHFGLLKRTAKKGKKVEIFRVTSGDKKTKNAVKLLTNALYNISNKRHLKNRLSCHKMYGTCQFYKTEHCR